MIDLTKVKQGDRLHHTKFAESPEIVRLIGSRISDGQRLSEDKAGLGDHILDATIGTAAAAGHAVGLILTAPVAVVDQKTRDNYGDRANALVGASAQARTAATACGAGRQGGDAGDTDCRREGQK